MDNIIFDDINFDNINFYIEQTRMLKHKLQNQKPLVHHITNFVTMYQCARITSFLGASPIMAFARAEVSEVTRKSNALVINTGTLNDEVICSIPKAANIANQLQIPVILDPVGINLSDYRHNFIMSLLSNCKFSVIRCNAVELMNLYGKLISGNGIDGALNNAAAPDKLQMIETAAAALAGKYHCTIACTGEIDIVSDGHQSIRLNRGCDLLPKLVGTGCMMNSLIGSYLAVADHAFDAAVAGILTMCLAGEQAKARLENINHLGTFETYLMDAIR